MPQVDLIVYNAKVYTINPNFDLAEAFAVKDGKFVAVGTSSDILKQFQSSHKLNLAGQFVYPGFYDAHCHFLRYSLMKNEVLLFDATSFEQVVGQLKQYHQTHPNSPLLVGRGWNEGNWDGKKYPDKKILDAHFPNTPVLLHRVDLHAAVANQKALDMAKATTSTQVEGGIFKTDEQGNLNGVLVDNAIHYVNSFLPQTSLQALGKAMLKAQADCHAVGLTSLNEAYVNQEEVALIEQLQAAQQLKMRFYCMVHHSEKNKQYYFENGPLKTDFLNVRCFKYFADGALGSRGAWLLNNYSDAATNGLQLLDFNEFVADCKLYKEKGFQVATHAIGDAANKLVLAAYAAVLQGKNKLRWRLEHAQIVQLEDIDKFGQNNITPSIQATHATSDMYWVGQRLGAERLKRAYAFKELLQQTNFVAAGSDFPVEKINPLLGFFAAVARQDVKGWPANGFQMENALSRQQALKAMTIWAAYSNFEEHERGSIEAHKMADFVVLADDLLQVPLLQIPDLKVAATFLGGEAVYG